MTVPRDPMGCTEAVEHLWDMLDGDLDATDAAAVERHLSWCMRCCGELAFAREMRSMLRRRSTVAVPADVQHRLEAFVDHLPDLTGGHG